MAGNIQIPQNLADVLDVKIVVEKKPEVLTEFLTSLVNELKDLTERVKELENDN